MPKSDPSLVRRRLGATLKMLRGGAGMNLDEAAIALGLSGASALSRIENGKRLVSTAALDAYFASYGVEDDSRRSELRKLVSLANSTWRESLQRQYRDAVPEFFADYLDLEDFADQADIFAPQIIPGILQTREYAHAVIDGRFQWRTEREVRAFAELCGQRQSLLMRDDPLSVWCVLDEAALRRCVGGPVVQLEQLQHLLDIHDCLPHVQLQVLPFSAGAHPGIDGAHTVFRFDSSSPVVVVESLTTWICLEEHVPISQYNMIFDHLCAQAMDAAASHEFIRAVIMEQREALG
ncbi:transcriptional regulator [Streptomyces sp. NBRC 13847]|uniref:helix-turn-helix domain-containing protein n=1 Tax=Streptomyces TaxID=1883 RepID=UPI0024A5B1D6|nr:helix-turn-helix transcriptional regulator [Streptomyces sp. NBRC 13847]GLW19887.1 transcriptional regulator [Streptomyces sp. NBRC 13847]